VVVFFYGFFMVFFRFMVSFLWGFFMGLRLAFGCGSTPVKVSSGGCGGGWIVMDSKWWVMVVLDFIGDVVAG
jgi:hypothetical protein